MFKGSGILVNFQSFEYFKILLVGGGGMDGKKGRWKVRKRLGLFFNEYDYASSLLFLLSFDLCRINNLIDSIPKRIRLLKKRKGQQIKY